MAKASAWTYEAKAIGHEAKAKVKAFKHMMTAEMNICSTSDSLTG